MCIDLFLAERLDRGTGVALGWLGVEGTAVDLALEVAVVLDLADLSLGEGSRLLEVGVRLGKLACFLFADGDTHREELGGFGIELDVGIDLPGCAFQLVWTKATTSTATASCHLALCCVGDRASDGGCGDD